MAGILESTILTNSQNKNIFLKESSNKTGQDITKYSVGNLGLEIKQLNFKPQILSSVMVTFNGRIKDSTLKINQIIKGGDSNDDTGSENGSGKKEDSSDDSSSRAPIYGIILIVIVLMIMVILGLLIGGYFYLMRRMTNGRNDDDDK